jgi:hypothetical protein
VTTQTVGKKQGPEPNSIILIFAPLIQLEKRPSALFRSLQPNYQAGNNGDTESNRSSGG